MNIAYIRVSTDKQHLSNQEQEIRNFAGTKNMKIDLWHREVVSGTRDKNTRALGSILDGAQKGDAIIVSEISRLSRRMFDIIGIMNTCIQKKVGLYSVKEGYVIGDDINSKVMGFAFSLSAEIERNLISMRTKEALAQRKASGVVLGRPKGPGQSLLKLIRNGKKIRERVSSGESISSLAREYGVSRGTFYTFLRSN